MRRRDDERCCPCRRAPEEVRGVDRSERPPDCHIERIQAGGPGGREGAQGDWIRGLPHRQEDPEAHRVHCDDGEGRQRGAGAAFGDSC